MLTKEEIEYFNKNGFLLVKQVLTPSELQKVKNFMDWLYEQPFKYPDDSEVRRPKIFDRYPQIRWLLYHPPIVQALRDLLGNDYGVFMDETVAINSYHFNYWHKDTSAVESLGYDDLWHEDFRVVNTLLYLQDNTEEYGGGLDVLPGSHLIADQELTEAGGFSKGEEENTFTVKSKAGDLVIIDLRITHRATPPIKEAKGSRRTISCWCGANTRHVQKLKQIYGKQNIAYKLIQEYYQKIIQVNPFDLETKKRLHAELIENINKTTRRLQ